MAEPGRGRVRLPGTKAGPGGCSLISTGLADLDLILGGGLPLGGLLLLLEVAGCSQPLGFLQHFLAEGMASSQDALWLAPARPAAYSLPRLAADQRAPKVAAKCGAQGSAGLRIAWQYRQYLEPEEAEQAAFDPAANRLQLRRTQDEQAPAAPPSQYCHVFDHSRSMPEAELSRLDRHGLAGDDALQQALSSCEDFTARHRPSSSAGSPQAQRCIGRLVLQSLMHPAYGCSQPQHLSPASPSGLLGAPDAASAKQLLRLVHSLRRCLAGSHCAAVMSVAPGSLSSSDLVRLQHSCDAVLRFQSLSSDSSIVKLAPDPSSCACLLNADKLPGLNLPACPLPRISQFMVRRYRRHLAIDVVEVDPDAEAGASGQPAASLDF